MAHPRSRALRRCTAVGLCLMGSLPAQQPGGTPSGRLRRVAIETADVFTPEQAEANLLYRLANALHGVTDREVIAREIWFAPGETITAPQVEELGRNLRALDLFGAVSTQLVDAGDGDVDLAIATRDRFSLGVSGGVSVVGGVTRVNGRLSEANLFGTGKEVVLVADRRDDGESTRYLRYTDPQLLGSWHTLETKVGETDEGWFANVDLARPLRHLADPWTYGVTYMGAEEDIDYYRFGETTAEVPARHHQLRLSAGRAHGPRELRTTLGVEARLRGWEYGDAFGPDAGRWRVPGDTDAIDIGPTLSVDYRPRFDQVRGLDTLDYRQDLPLGAGFALRLGEAWRHEAGAGSELQPLLESTARLAAAVQSDTYVTLQAHGRGRFGGDRLRAYDTGVALHVFQRSLPAQTLALSATYDRAYDGQDLSPQLTLGEDNGLRGYPAREFAGSRYARINLEDRIDTGISLWSVHLGLVAFFDVGFVHDPVTGLSMGDPIRSAGFGFRFGSSHLLGARVLRLDVAWPLDDVAGNDYGVSVSIATGQVFGFFGNASELGVVY